MVGEKFGFRELQRILLLRTTPCSNSAFHLSRLPPTYFVASLLFVFFLVPGLFLCRHRFLIFWETTSCPPDENHAFFSFCFF